MNHHERTIDVNTRLVTAGAVLTATGAMMVCAGAVIGTYALLTVGRRMIRDMDVPPSQQAAAKWQQAKEASRAGMQAWHAASDSQNGALAR
ncbi:hypothetical protein AB0M28_21995 [Streptomyces sp. NPDC051940]|uniref:hypothetical protein n=1 Tax=Streptomyces sp. NPDC051940 TaxID=3155675 RepID=UPI0034451A5C